MATPFAHAHVLHVSSRSRRRRSQSVTLFNPNEENTPAQSIQRKQFLAQLQKEQQKHQNNYNGQHENGFESQEEQQHDEEDDHEPTITRVIRPTTTMSMKKHTPSSTVVNTSGLSREMSSVTSSAIHTQENEEYHGHQPQIIRIPRSKSAMSSKNQISPTIGNNTNLDSSATFKGMCLNTSTTSSNIFSSSTSNLIPKSGISDQKFHPDDTKDNTRRNGAKSNGMTNINGQENGDLKRKLPTRSSASFMTAIIAIIIAIIAFAFGLTALILVLLLRSTVAASLGTNSTTSGSSASSSSGGGSLPSACSAYTPLNDPTRNVYAAGYALGCDNTSPFTNQSNPVWIRFIGTGGTTLPLQTPGLNLCGSTGTGWYSGTMPSSTGQIINGTACFTWYTSVCQYSSSISVANCGSFYIYRLPPTPACMMRYCTV